MPTLADTAQNPLSRLGLLASIFSAGNTAKRRLNNLLEDPRGSFEQFVGQLGDDTTTNLRNQTLGYGIGGAKSTNPAEVAAARKALADYGAQFAMAAAIQPFHNDVLRSISKGIPDDVSGAAFGADGFIYHTPYRPFENAQQTAIGVKANSLGERLFSTSTPLSAKVLQSIEAVPVSDSASHAFAKELGDEGAMGFFNKDGKRFSVVMPSAKNQGMYQATQYDPKGAIGDSQHDTQANAILRMMNGGYSKVMDDQRIESLLNKVMLSK